MDRSVGFVSTPYDLFALFTLAFALAPQRLLLNLAIKRNSLAHHAKGTPSAIVLTDHRPSTVCKLLVSGSISLRYQRFFSPFLRSTGSLSVID